LIFVLVDADRKDSQIGAVVMELDQAGHFLNAGDALRPPEIEQDDLTAVAGEMDGRDVVSDSEVGSELASEAGTRAAVAGRNQCQRHK
jgi:hypothetical protein